MIPHPDDMGLDPIDRNLVHDCDNCRPCYSQLKDNHIEDVSLASAAVLAEQFDDIAKLPIGLRYERLADYFHTCIIAYLEFRPGATP